MDTFYAVLISEISHKQVVVVWTCFNFYSITTNEKTNQVAIEVATRGLMWHLLMTVSVSSHNSGSHI